MIRSLLQIRAPAIVLGLALALASGSIRAEEPSAEPSAALRLGKRLFVEKRFTNPASNFAGNCYACHRPDWAPEGRRAYSDVLQYSLVPTDSRSRKRTTRRNAPTLMDVGGLERFNHDGRYPALTQVIAAELVSSHLGWLPEEREIALDEIHLVLLSDAGVDKIAEGTYLEQFQEAYGVDLAELSREQAVGWVVRCLAEFVASLTSPRTSAYDAFIRQNDLPAAPDMGVSGGAFGEELLAGVARLEREGRLALHAAFGPSALAGFKIFMRTTGQARSGHCVACHVPPLFTDGTFHNTAVAQIEYDAVHGAGAFAQLAIPPIKQAQRPDEQFSPHVENGTQIHADLGYWNFAEPGAARTGGDTTDMALGAFKTPTLRNLEFSDPYMHNGAYPTLLAALSQKVEACALARRDALRGGDATLKQMNISAEDIAPLAAFLTALTDVSNAEFNKFLDSAKPVTEVEPKP